MKNLARTTTVIAALLSSSLALANDVKNVPGLVCIRSADSAAAKTSEYVTAGRLCNDSTTQRLKVNCPLTQDMGTDESMSTTIDYVNLQPKSQGGDYDANFAFECTIQTRTRYGNAYFYGGWQNVQDYPNNWGDTPSALFATAPMLDDGSSTVICVIPQKSGSDRSCVSHIKYDEHE